MQNVILQNPPPIPCRSSSTPFLSFPFPLPPSKYTTIYLGYDTYLGILTKYGIIFHGPHPPPLNQRLEQDIKRRRPPRHGTLRAEAVRLARQCSRAALYGGRARVIFVPVVPIVATVPSIILIVLIVIPILHTDIHHHVVIMIVPVGSGSGSGSGSGCGCGCGRRDKSVAGW